MCSRHDLSLLPCVHSLSGFVFAVAIMQQQPVIKTIPRFLTDNHPPEEPYQLKVHEVKGEHAVGQRGWCPALWE